MVWKNIRSVNKLNKFESNVYVCKGKLEDIGKYIYVNEGIKNFLISGGNNDYDRHIPLYNVLESIIGKMPIIIIHSNNKHIEAIVKESWSSLKSRTDISTPIWMCDGMNSMFEPFYGMNEMQIVNTLRQLALKLNYTVTPRFEKVIRAHLSILTILKIPFSLSGLYYLCKFEDMGEFYSNIMELDCVENVKRRIWADLGAADDNGSGEFDLFRAVINNLANDAEQSGWNSDNLVNECNCMQAINQNAIFTLSINDMYTSMLIPYLTEELKTKSMNRFFLLFDEVSIKDDTMIDYLCTASTQYSFGIISKNAVNQIGNKENTFLRLSERLNCIVLYKHGTGTTATTLSEVFGKYDYTKVEESQGVSKGFFNFLPQNRHDDVRISTENRYRVMPEKIIGLKDNQAIIFDMDLDQIIHYN